MTDYCRARMALATTMLLGGTTTAVLVGAPAQAAPTPLDCGSGPVVITDSTASYELVGTCTAVTLKGDNLTVTLTSVA